MEGTRQGKPITLGGVSYISIAAACRALAPRLKISPRQVEVRIRRGWPEKHILHVGPMRGPGAWDHLGRHYRNELEMCKAWGVKYATFRRRLYRGCSLEEALTYVKRRRPTVDHTGRAFPTFRAMCAAWGQPERRVARRLVNGRSLKDALTAPPAASGRPPEPCTDHTGHEFPSLGAMCAAWGIAQGLVCNRIRCMGWSLERALTTPVRRPWGMRED